MVGNGEPELLTAQNDGLINSFNPVQLSAWRANVDIQYCAHFQRFDPDWEEWLKVEGDFKASNKERLHVVLSSRATDESVLLSKMGSN